MLLTRIPHPLHLYRVTSKPQSNPPERSVHPGPLWSQQWGGLGLHQQHSEKWKEHRKDQAAVPCWDLEAMG